MLAVVRSLQTGAQLGEVHTAACVCRLVSVMHIRNLGFGLFAFSHPCDSRYHASIAITCSNLRCALDQLISTETSMPARKRVFQSAVHETISETTWQLIPMLMQLIVLRNP